MDFPCIGAWRRLSPLLRKWTVRMAAPLTMKQGASKKGHLWLVHLAEPMLFLETNGYNIPPTGWKKANRHSLWTIPAKFVFIAFCSWQKQKFFLADSIIISSMFSLPTREEQMNRWTLPVKRTVITWTIFPLCQSFTCQHKLRRSAEILSRLSALKRVVFQYFYISLIGFDGILMFGGSTTATNIPGIK